MAKKSSARLSAGELELLDVLWQNSGLTIRKVQEALSREVGYTTVQTRLNRLVAKGYAKKSSSRPGLYSAVLKQRQATGNDLNSLLDRVTQGSVVPLIAHLVKDRRVTDDEILEIRKLIDDAEASRKERGK